MKKLVLPLLLALIGTGAYAQTKVKTKTPSGKTKHTVATHPTVVQGRAIGPDLLPPPSPDTTPGRTAAPEKLGVYAVDDEQGGALVQHVIANSPAALAGLKSGDVIVK